MQGKGSGYAPVVVTVRFSDVPVFVVRNGMTALPERPFRPPLDGRDSLTNTKAQKLSRRQRRAERNIGVGE
ncbi:MAG: hypothetical protein MI824_13515 [Hyphomicrobiales bacterium]|nr:hypothetical protein [Hyphomicrobiales bacterium]